MLKTNVIITSSCLLLLLTILSCTVRSQQASCLENEFRCDDGTCIDNFSVCDGQRDCSDGSDETNQNCSKSVEMRSCLLPRQPHGGVYLVGGCSVGGISDKCRRIPGTVVTEYTSLAYSCLEGFAISDTYTTRDCVMGRWTPDSPLLCLELCKGLKSNSVTINCEYQGKRLADCSDPVLPGTKATIRCTLPYQVSQNISVSSDIVCRDNGKWSESLFPCIPELCDGLKSTTVVIDCEYRGKKISNCSEPVLPGTRATLRCIPWFKLQSTNAPKQIFCRDNGEWSESLFNCVPECGIRTHKNAATPLITYGENTSAVEYPWAAGLYKFNRKIGYLDLYCGGSIITPNMILSVAHCLFENHREIRAAEIRVAVGKTIRSWKVEDVGEQRFNVEKVILHPDYRASDNHYAFDIGIFKLNKEIVIGRVSLPVCIEWNPPWRSIPNGTPVTVVGWGRTEDDELSHVLRSVSLAFLDQRTCRNIRSSSSFRLYITHDKFCADYKNGAGVQPGDSGGGVFFLNPKDGLYYVHGLVSVKPQDENIYATFTNISIKTHMDFLRETCFGTPPPISVPLLISRNEWIQNFKECADEDYFRCNSGCIKLDQVCDGKRDCEDGSDEHYTLCSFSKAINSTNKNSCKIPDGIESYKVLTCQVQDGCNNSLVAPQNSIYNVTCPPGYGFADPTVSGLTVVCTSSGKWSPNILKSRCLRLCPRLEVKTLETRCSYRGQLTGCDQNLRPYTEIRARCKQFYKPPTLANFTSRTVCLQTGSVQNQLSECIPVCGVEETAVQALSSTYQKLKYIKYPWHVAIYEKRGTKYEYICGGTIIHPNKVLTAAQCTWDDNTKQVKTPDNLAVAAGKLRRQWDSNEGTEQKVGVSQVMMGLYYSGHLTKYAQDIAVLILERALKPSYFSMPACLDLDFSHGGIPPDQPGLVLGWSGQTEDDQPSDRLVETRVHYLDLKSCIQRFNQSDFVDYIRPDKFCALYINGTGPQTGSSGGGLTFTHDGLHYLYGIVSIKKRNQNEFAVFTNVHSHSSWLQKILDD